MPVARPVLLGFRAPSWISLRAAVALLAIGVCLHVTPAAGAHDGRIVHGPGTKGRYTGYPLPRFASLRSNHVNLRRGPGFRYRIDWVLHRRHLPVQIFREFHDWRAVRLPDGTEGWIKGALLAGRRSFVVVQGRTVPLRHAARADAAPVAWLKPGVVGRLLDCAAGSSWCRVRVDDNTGYVPRKAIWGVAPHEVVDE
jgi:SH3-like domain-containing protein